MFSIIIVPNYLPVAGKLVHFLKAWEILTKDAEILGIAMEFKIPFSKIQQRREFPRSHTWIKNKQL